MNVLLFPPTLATTAVSKTTVLGTWKYAIVARESIEDKEVLG